MLNGRSSGSAIRFRANCAAIGTIKSAGFDLGSGKALLINDMQVVGAQGSSLPADATDLASVIALANAIKARIKATGDTA